VQVELLPNYPKAMEWDFVEDIQWFEDLLPNPNNFFGNKNVANVLNVGCSDCSPTLLYIPP
jgi:hypothetical protein